MIYILSVILLGIVCNSNIQSGEHNSESIKQDEWEYLFDGQTLKGWKSFQKDSITGWAVEDGTLAGLGLGGELSGDIISEKKFDNFELSLEWKIAPGGNSGIMFHVVEEGHKYSFETGPEYQVIDDRGYPGNLQDWQKTGANYAMHDAKGAEVFPAGEWNSTRIIVNKSHVEHWLNGKKIVEYELWSEDWNQRVNNGKWKDYPDYGKAGKGHIALQDHGSRVWFRNIKIREL